MNFQNILLCYSSYKDKDLKVTNRLVQKSYSILTDISMPHIVDVICTEDKGSIEKAYNLYD